MTVVELVGRLSCAVHGHRLGGVRAIDLELTRNKVGCVVVRCTRCRRFVPIP